MIIKISIALLTIYLIAVLRVYSLTLYYDEFDGHRKNVWLAPFGTLELFIYVIMKKDLDFIGCFFLHLPTTYIIISLQYCLMRTKKADSKRYIKRRSVDMAQLHNKTEKLILQY